MKKYFIQLFLLICLFSSCENNNLHEGSYKETTSTTNGTIQNKHKKESENRGGNSSLIAWIALCVALAPHIKKLATYYLDHNGGKTHKRGEYGYHISEPDKQIMSLGEKREENEEKGGLTFGLKYDNTNETDLPTEQSPSQPLVTDMSCQTILYARESKTNILSSVESYQKGKTIYRLILESENSKTATIELCLEKNDTKNRVKKFYNEKDFIGEICEIQKLSEEQSTEEDIKELESGQAERIDNHWRVTKKIILGVR